MDEPATASIEQHIEALIFASDRSISVAEIRYIIGLVFGLEFTEAMVLAAIQAIKERYQVNSFAIELIHLDEGYQFLTKRVYYPVINQLQVHRCKKKLSQPAIETLAIIAYNQPITKLEIEQIRGVNCDYTIQKLLEKDLIKIVGKADMVGRPILYATSTTLMDYLGINSVTELPQFNEVIVNKNEASIPFD